jgi:hypothetical protein
MSLNPLMDSIFVKILVLIITCLRLRLKVIQKTPILTFSGCLSLFNS